ncbi:MAG: hypothetical protein RL228_1145 [Actinomycetota bacterium]|jgi:hypothetical protein
MDWGELVMISDFWLSLDASEREHRIAICDFAIKGRLKDFDAITYLYSVQVITAVEAQALKHPEHSTPNSKKNLQKEADLFPDSPYLSPEQCETLSLSSSWQVRSRIARNLVTPASVLESMSLDSDPNVLIGVSANPNTPVHTIFELLNDNYADLSARTNLALPSDFLTEKIQDKSLGAIRFTFASNWSASKLDCTLLFQDFNLRHSESKLISSKFEQVLKSLSVNPFIGANYFDAIISLTLKEIDKAFDAGKYRKSEHLEEILQNLAGNPGLPSKQWQRLLDDWTIPDHRTKRLVPNW